MAWGRSEKETWFREQELQRSYRDEVIAKVERLKFEYEVTSYGSLSIDPARYPLYMLRSKNFDPVRKSIFLTGGVHGYETSGVQGALAFLSTTAEAYRDKFNFVCAPCISPWAYETVNRWNPAAIDPNRSFTENSPAEECRALMTALAQMNCQFFAHFDLHETTDTDNLVFRPALEKRDGVVHEFSEIPDGFYLVGDTENPQPEFQKAVIDEVRKVTHIALPDAQGKLIGVPIEQEGVINYPVKKLSLCASLTNAAYTTTTEVYPDSPRTTPETCVQAQIAAIRGGLDYLIKLFPA